MRWRRTLTIVLAVAAMVALASAAASASETEPEIVIVGGSAVVSEGLADHLRSCTSGGLERIAGQDRYETAAAVAQHWATSNTVFLATGLNFPDAIAGGPVAGLNGSPVLLTHPDWLPASTNAAITRLAPQRVVILGGPAAIAPAIEDGLRTRVPEVIRLAGVDRFATAEAIADWEFPDGADVVYVATGMAFHDALLAGPRAVRDEAPLLLVTRDTVPAATGRALSKLAPSRIVLVGGTGAVSEVVAAELATHGSVERIAGATFAETAVAAGAGAPGSRVFVATREAFADGLALIPLSEGAPTYFVRVEKLNGPTATAISARTGVPCAAWTPPYPDGGSGQRIIYSVSEQRVWLINADGTLKDTYLVSGRRNRPYPGTYHVFSKSPLAWAGHDGITMEHMVRFVRPREDGNLNRLSIGFHAIPRYRDGTPMQTEAQLGTFQSGGCVRQSDEKATALYRWTPLGTKVVVLQ